MCTISLGSKDINVKNEYEQFHDENIMENNVGKERVFVSLIISVF